MVRVLVVARSRCEPARGAGRCVGLVASLLSNLMLFLKLEERWVLGRGSAAALAGVRRF